MEIHEIELAQLERVLGERRCIAILFSLDVCAPCGSVLDAIVQVAPLFPRLERCYVLKVVYGISHEDPRLADIGVRHFPTLVVLQAGELLGVLRGAITKSGPLNAERLARWLTSSLGQAVTLTTKSPSEFGCIRSR